MLNLGCFGKERKKKRKRGTGSAGGQNELLPVLSPLSQQRKSIVAKFLGPVLRQVGAMACTSVHDRSAMCAAAPTTVVRAHVIGISARDRALVGAADGGLSQYKNLCCDRPPTVPRL